MIVVTDTTPLNYLVLIGAVDILAALFSRVVIPGAVFAELPQVKMPEVVRHWVLQHSASLDVRTASPPPCPIGLDSGEEEAISLALALGAAAWLPFQAAPPIRTSELGGADSLAGCYFGCRTTRK